MMDDQLAEMIRDRFNKVDADNAVMIRDLKEHAVKDEAYWRQIDEHRAQLGLVKWLIGTSAGSAALAWLYSKFGH